MPRPFWWEVTEHHVRLTAGTSKAAGWLETRQFAILAATATPGPGTDLPSAGAQEG